MAGRKRFKREKRQYLLRFDPEQFPDLEGFECVCTGATLEQFVGVAALSEVLKTEDGRTEENIRKQYEVFARFLKSWNLDDDDDEPVPCTYEGLASLEIDFVLAIQAAWQQALASVPKASNENLPSGDQSGAESRLQLASLSENLAS